MSGSNISNASSGPIPSCALLASDTQACGAENTVPMRRLLVELLGLDNRYSIRNFEAQPDRMAKVLAVGGSIENAHHNNLPRDDGVPEPSRKAVLESAVRDILCPLIDHTAQETSADHYYPEKIENEGQGVQVVVHDGMCTRPRTTTGAKRIATEEGYGTSPACPSWTMSGNVATDPCPRSRATRKILDLSGMQCNLIEERTCGSLMNIDNYMCGRN